MTTAILATAMLFASPVPARPPAEASLLQLISAHGAWLLDGYRMPTAEDMRDDWMVVGDYEKDPPHRISADFNGDGAPDYAFILLSSTGYRIRLAALVSGASGFRALKLLDQDAESVVSQHRYVVEVVRPGRYETAAGKGYFEVSAADPAEVTLTNPAIDFIYTESANSFFYWDAAQGNFQRVWISD